MKLILLSINYGLMILIPIIVALFIRRRTAAPWRLWFIGAATFIASQVLHIPFNFVVQRSGLLPSEMCIRDSPRPAPEPARRILLHRAAPSTPGGSRRAGWRLSLIHI